MKEKGLASDDFPLVDRRMTQLAASESKKSTTAEHGPLERATRHSRPITFMFVLLLVRACRREARQALFRCNSPVLTELQVEYSTVIVVFAWLCSYTREERCVNPIVIASLGPTWAQNFPIPQPTECHCFQTFNSLYNSIHLTRTPLITHNTTRVNKYLRYNVLHFPWIFKLFFHLAFYKFTKKFRSILSRLLPSKQFISAHLTAPSH